MRCAHHQMPLRWAYQSDRVTTRTVIFLMALLQIVWLVLIWWSGAAPHPEKLLPLLLYSLLAAVVVDCLPRIVLKRLSKLSQTLLQSGPQVWMCMALLFLCVGGLYARSFQGWADERHVFAAAKIVAEQGFGPFFDQYIQIPWLGQQHPPLV